MRRRSARAGTSGPPTTQSTTSRNGPDWAGNVISPETNFITDVEGGTLANVTWVYPTSSNSDYSGSAGRRPVWVTAVVNAVGNSQFWDSSAIFVTWDDWGGFYDPVPPPLLDYDGLGIRMPLIIISPYALGLKNKKHVVTHTQYEFGSLLKFAEQTFGLSSLAASDARANVFGTDVLNFSQSPRPLSNFSAPLSRQHILSQPHSILPPDT